MSIMASAGSVNLFTVDRTDVSPPLLFPSIENGIDSTHSIWVYPTNNIPVDLIRYVGYNGNVITIGHNGEYWYINGRVGSTVVFSRNFAWVMPNRWSVFAFAINGWQFSVYGGEEDPANPDIHTTPISMTLMTQFGYPIDVTPFHYHQVLVSSNLAVCNFKFWNAFLSLEEATAQVNRWDTNNGGFGPTPFWASPMRTVGDISNIANPTNDSDWYITHYYYAVQPADNLRNAGDPAYLASNQPCPTRIYAVVPHGTNNCTYNPEGTPAEQTTYKAPETYYFADRGALPVLVTHGTLISIQYYGFPSSTGPGVPQIHTWGLYRDQNGVDYNSDLMNPANRFETNGWVTPVPEITLFNLYQWQFGAMFTWAGRVPEVPTATASLTGMFLMVNYQGYPSGVPGLPYVDMAGLFAIQKGSFHDKYNRGTILKIPDPTIKTAYIGE